MALDLFCGPGGATRGYQQAGFYVVGVDIEDQPNYCGDEFVCMDALGWEDFGDFDLVHSSPPCQHFTAYRRNKSVNEGIEDRYENLIPETRELLQRLGVPFVIENLPKAPLRCDVQLCGSHFKTNPSSPYMDIRRHRWFEVEGFVIAQPKCDHKIWQKRKYKPSSNRTNKRFTIEIGAWNEPLPLQKACMGVNWEVTVRELSEAIPPAYTRYIGEQFMEEING